MLKLRQKTKNASDAIAAEGADAGGSVSGRKKARRKRSKKKLIIGLAVALVVLAGAGAGIAMLFTDEELPAVTDTLTYGALSKAISGTGVTVAADTETYSLPSSEAEVTGWYVEAGDEVNAGDLLFEQDDSEVDELIAEYEDEILEYEVEIQELNENLAEAQSNMANLTVTAPFSGRITDISVELDDSVSTGRTLATITDDSEMKLTQYFSYMYEDSVYVGMSAMLSVPDQMMNVSGEVTEIEWVDYVTPEGMKCFAVTIEVSNPGSLDKGMGGACWLYAADGTEIYPASENDTLYYANEKTITCKTSGTVSGIYAVEYQSVNSGALLFTIDSSSYESQISSFEKQIDNYETKIETLQESIAEADESRENYKRYSEISGKVVSSNYETMRGGMVMGSVSIYNLDTMTISVNFDELDVDQLEVGQSVSVYRSTSSATEQYDAEITYISLEATNSNGVSTFAGEITIYSNGALSAGVNVSYSVDIGDTMEGVLAPVDALHSYNDGYYLIVKSDERPENALDVDAEYPEGFYAVPVEIGSSNSSNVYVISGAEEGDVVFLRYQQSAPSGGDKTSEGDGTTGNGTGFEGGSMPEGMPQGNFGQNQQGGMPDFGGMGMPGGQ